MSKSPAFQFYPDDWLSCEKVSMMSPECEGAYIRLLSYAWRSEDCGLPNDDEKLAVLSRLGVRWECDGIKYVKPCFIEKDGRLYNKRMLEELKKQKIYRAKQSENAKHRWGKDLSGMPPHSQRNAKTIPPQCSSSSSSSSSSNSKNKTTWLTPFNEVWKKYYQVDMSFSKAVKPLQSLLKAFSEQAICDGLDKYLSATDVKYASIAGFAEKAGKWIGITTIIPEQPKPATMWELTQKKKIIVDKIKTGQHYGEAMAKLRTELEAINKRMEEV